MKKETKYALEKLQKAYSKLKEGVLKASDDLQQDGVIQRFEFTFELLWKGLKIYLENEKGVLARSPRDVFKEAFRLGLLEDEEALLNMLEDRNKMSHIYNHEEAEKIFKKIKNHYLSPIESILKKLV